MDQQKVAHSNWHKKRRGKDAVMFCRLIYFFAPFSVFYIPHNYVILQAMPLGIPQIHSAFYPNHTWYTLISRNWKELATMSCNIIIITIFKIFRTKKLKSKYVKCTWWIWKWIWKRIWKRRIFQLILSFGL